MDLDGGGKVLFDEFAHWALCRHLRLEGSEKEDEEELPMPAQPNLAATGAAKAAAAAAAAVKAAEKPPSYITEGGSNSLTATLAGALTAAAEEASGEGRYNSNVPIRNKHGVMARVASCASTPQMPAVRSRRLFLARCCWRISASATRSVTQPPASPKEAWALPPPRVAPPTTLHQRVRPRHRRARPLSAFSTPEAAALARGPSARQAAISVFSS